MKPFVRSNMKEQAPNHYNIQRIENFTLRVSLGNFQAEANLQTGNVTGCYYDTKSQVTFDCPKETHISCEIKSNQKIHSDYYKPTSMESHPYQE